MRRLLGLRIAGRVQGVGYRDWMTAAARDGGVDGWVRNMPDGTVEAAVAGPPDAVDALIAACRRGPHAARVTSVEIAPAEDPGLGFRRLPTPR